MQRRLVSKDRGPATEKSEVKSTQDQESYDGDGQCMLGGLQSHGISLFLGRCSAPWLPLVYFPVFQAE